MRASPRCLPEFNYEERTENVNSRKTSFLFPQASSTAIWSWVPVALAHTQGWGRSALCSSQGHPRGWDPRLSAPRKPPSPATMDPIQCPALVSVTLSAAALPPRGPKHNLTAQRGRVQQACGMGTARASAELREEEVILRAGKLNSVLLM